MSHFSLLIPVFLLVISLHLDSGWSLESKNGIKFRNPKSHAERLIRGMNLFPKDDVNIGRGEPQSELLVEKRVRFTVLDDGSGTSIQDLGHHAGYYRLPHTKDARMFYFFFESRKKINTDPVVIWLAGGPGCGSEVAIFYENGPFHITKNLSLAWNDYGWDQVSNLIYVDQPTGTCFSYSSDDEDIRHDESGVSNDLYDFLQEFFKHHPEYVKNDFFITGESYAGHYIPAFGSRVHAGNKDKTGIHINLKGFAIGNGLTNPEIQYKAYPDYAKEMKILTDITYNLILKEIPPCEQQIKLCGTKGGDACISAFVTCTRMFMNILSFNLPIINPYDVRKHCNGSLCYDFGNLEKFMNEDSVRKALGVGDIEYVSCSSTVYNAMIMDVMKNLEVGIPALLEDNINMLIYAGEYDLMCNWLGNYRWVHEMEWSGKNNFAEAHNVSYLVDGVKAGLMKSYGPLTFLKVYNAGHLVPMDQPKASLDMLQKWTQGKLSSGAPKVGPEHESKPFPLVFN